MSTRTSVRSVAGRPSAGSVWVKSLAGWAPAHELSSSLPSTAMEPCTGPALIAGAAACRSAGAESRGEGDGFWRMATRAKQSGAESTPDIGLQECEYGSRSLDIPQRPKVAAENGRAVVRSGGR